MTEEKQGMFRRLAERWIEAAVMFLFASILGGIIWGVQINFALVSLARNSQITAGRLDSIEDNHLIISDNLLKQSIILKALRNDNDRIEETVIRHNSESEGWKQKIERLDERTLRLQESVENE